MNPWLLTVPAHQLCTTLVTVHSLKTPVLDPVLIAASGDAVIPGLVFHVTVSVHAPVTR